MDKTCIRCKKSLPQSRFYVVKNRGPLNICKSCTGKNAAAWRKRNPWKDKKCRQEFRKRWKARTPLKVRSKKYRADDLKRKYGLTIEQYDSLLERQGGKCAICGIPPQKRLLAVDHDHRTGQNRGLLCCVCNHALERLETDADWPEKARFYLKEFYYGAHV
ncbi:MAG: endonuclease VII domain-containing protein [Candidatus Brocadiales bacterium]|nr:endonuclease VII domain-containing protein [Candidatus Bathyanammoxibius sp.]